MSRTVFRDYPEYVTGLFTETTGANITTTTFEVGLSSSAQTPPDVWETPDLETRPSTSTARVSKLIDTDDAAGTWYLWVKAADSPETPVRAAASVPIVVV